MVPTLGTILGALVNIGFKEWISHKVIPVAKKYQLHKQTDAEIKVALGHICTPAVVDTLYNAITKGALQTKKEIKGCGVARDLRGVTLKRLTALTQVNAALFDLTSLKPASMAVTAAGLQSMRQAHSGRAGARVEHEKHATEVLIGG